MSTEGAAPGRMNPGPWAPVTLRGWTAVGAAFQRYDAACEECQHRRAYTQRHPYGEGYSTEHLSDCGLGDRPSDTPDLCPALSEEVAS